MLSKTTFFLFTKNGILFTKNEKRDYLLPLNSEGLMPSALLNTRLKCV
jgi:hypothetical protein